MITKKLTIRGYVQGVGYRFSMVDRAESIGVTGWVRNARDGTVEAVVQGSEEQVQAIIEWAKKGPAGAEVTQVDIEDESGQFTGFEIERSV